ANVVDILLRDKKITEEQIAKLRVESLRAGTPIDNLLSGNHIVSDEDLTLARSESYNIPFIDLNTIDISRDILNIFDEKTAKGHNSLAFALNGNNISVAMA